MEYMRGDLGRHLPDLDSRIPVFPLTTFIYSHGLTNNVRDIRAIIAAFRTGLQALYDQRLRSLVLYGSYARGDARVDSDIDLMVVLAGEVKPVEEIDRMLDLVTDLSLEHGVCISAFPVSEEKYASSKSPLMLNVRREGVPA